MSNNPYQAPRYSDPDAPNRYGSDGGSIGPLAGFGARFGAYLIDVLPITLLVGVVFYVFLGFDEQLQRYAAAPRDITVRAEYLVQRNQIRFLSFIVYIFYSALLEGSAMQGTIGKRLLGLRVTDEQRNRLSMGRSFGRNLAKIISYIPCGLGFLWALWSRDKCGWHDMIARTLVTRR